LKEAAYDVVVANIMADVVMELAPWVRGWMKPNGRFLASGVIEERAPEVAGALEAAGFRMRDMIRKRDWVLLVFAMD
jgi:ribosomal protein L11 methyltransferase